MKGSGVISTGQAYSLEGANMTPPHQEYRTIPLTRGQVTIVDAADYGWLSQWKWHAVWSRCTNGYYAARGTYAPDGRKTTLSMHRVIAGVDRHDPHQVDHRNHDTLDNRRANLRACTNSENKRNARRRSDNSSGYKGVYKITGCERWAAQITANGVLRYLGCYKTPELAASVVRAQRELLHGEFANHGDNKEETEALRAI